MVAADNSALLEGTQAAFYMGPSWTPVGPQLGPSWAPVEPSWAKLGHIGPKLGPSWAKLGPSWAKLDTKKRTFRQI